MSFTWNSPKPPAKGALGPVGIARAALRGAVLVVILMVGVALSAVIRLVEHPLYKLHRPWTPYITQWVCRMAFIVLGMRHEVQGTPMPHAGAVVANHASWLDIFALNARKRVYFVSKSEVANWPGIGLLARITGTVFINRDPKQARAQTEVFEGRLLAGHKLLFFPEGSSTDGMRVLLFKSTLFQALFSENIRHEIYVQPVTVIYHAPPDQDPRFYGWWGDMTFGAHALRMLAQKHQGHVRVVYHPSVKVDEFENRKALATHVEKVVRSAMPKGRQGR